MDEASRTKRPVKIIDFGDDLVRDGFEANSDVRIEKSVRRSLFVIMIEAFLSTPWVT